MTGKQEEHENLSTSFLLLPNCSTEISKFEIPVSPKSKDEVLESTNDHTMKSEEEQQTVIAVYLYKNGNQIARAVNWPEPLKYAYLPKPKNIALKLIPSVHDVDGTREDFKPPQIADAIDISSDVPIKGFVLNVVDRQWGEDHDIAFEDRGIDLIPGEFTTMGVRGLTCGDEDKLTAQYLGM